MTIETEIRMVYARLSQGTDPPTGAALVAAIAEQVNATPGQIEAVIGFAEPDVAGPAARDDDQPAVTGFAGHATGFAVPGAPDTKENPR